MSDRRADLEALGFAVTECRDSNGEAYLHLRKGALWLDVYRVGGVNVAASDSADRLSYRVSWSDEDDEFVGTCDAFPSLSWLAATQHEALSGIVELARKALCNVLNEVLATIDVDHLGESDLMRLVEARAHALRKKAARIVPEQLHDDVYHEGVARLDADARGDLDALVDAITPDNVHAETATGPDVGAEVVGDVGACDFVSVDTIVLTKQARP